MYTTVCLRCTQVFLLIRCAGIWCRVVVQVFPHEYRRVLAERAMAEEQAKINKHGSFILQYQEEDIISEELLKKEAVSNLCLCVCVSVHSQHRCIEHLWYYGYRSFPA